MTEKKIPDEIENFIQQAAEAPETVKRINFAKMLEKMEVPEDDPLMKLAKAMPSKHETYDP